METWKHGNMETWGWRHGGGDIETWKHGNMETWRHGDMDTWRHGDMDMEPANGNREPRRFSFVRSPFAHRANRSLSLALLLTKKQTENGINGLNEPNILAHLCS